jgi:hypothetical protein
MSDALSAQLHSRLGVLPEHVSLGQQSVGSGSHHTLTMLLLNIILS